MVGLVGFKGSLDFLVWSFWPLWLRNDRDIGKTVCTYESLARKRRWNKYCIAWFNLLRGSWFDSFFVALVLPITSFII